ncbi:PQQ-binding-like beta-propeller repeat protein [Haloterrigena sp. SYSU A121-1]|uniref:PQQ-binding-like beta-propeller repeat protein n=1 Tax=Haloterrigena gelatinilytica TaxID=2741724 RepID=A0A8J8KCR2_9EURY|nr:PQQ-binding-like beta-propeller repeat protein [Haloterrigena gelatinilytica]NUB92680.1 PQQ-binding-like beta-propeller repeat protein [Haloterrigena gelatinilytica]
MGSVLTRRRLLGAAGGPLLGAFLLGPRVGGSGHVDPDPGSGWHQPRTDARNVARTADPGPGSDGRVGWAHSLDAHRRFEHAGLALVDGTLLVPTHRSLRAIDVESGAERWRYAYRDLPVGPFDRPQLDTAPRIRDGVVYLAFQADVCALELDSQRLRWRYSLDGSVDGVHLFGNTAYATGRLDGEDRLLAIDANTGLERWRKTGRVIPLAARSGLLVGARYESGRLLGLEPETGTRRWLSDAAIGAATLNRGSVAAVDDLVVGIESNGDLTALEADTGERRWTVFDDVGEPNTYRRSVAVDPSDRAIYRSRPDASTISRIDFAGDEEWRIDESALEFGVSVGGGTVYASTTGGLLALEADAGDERFRVSVDPDGTDPLGGTPLIADDRVYHLLGETVYEVTPR